MSVRKVKNAWKGKHLGGNTGEGGEVWDSCLLCALQQGKWVTGFYNVYIVYLVVYYVALLPPSSSDKERPHYFSRAVDSTPHLFHVLLRKVCLSSGRHILLARRVTRGRITLFKYSFCG